ncbi:siderophore-interacting protein [Massilia sp. DWR3-1-1]|uniref:siderophore-interacting protein n=1 Tax=Massilia sp. DWR3-1-1 TaxID=2804559 RepID=UPI003CED44C7
MRHPPYPSRVQRMRHETTRRELDVLRVDQIGAHFRSVVLGGAALAGFTSDSFDDHVKVILPPVGGDGADGPVMRDYTPRHFDRDRGELTIEFCLHGDGPAASWAGQAAPGQHLTVGGPRGSLIIPLDYSWHLLVGDETALPAISRRLEELPAGSLATVIVCVADARDQRSFASRATCKVEWVSNAQQLLERVRALSLPGGDNYAWCAGEARTMAALRAVLVDDKGMDRHAVRAAAYWKQGAIAHHENLQD